MVLKLNKSILRSKRKITLETCEVNQRPYKDRSPCDLAEARDKNPGIGNRPSSKLNGSLPQPLPVEQGSAMRGTRPLVKFQPTGSHYIARFVLLPLSRGGGSSTHFSAPFRPLDEPSGLEPLVDLVAHCSRLSSESTQVLRAFARNDRGSIR